MTNNIRHLLPVLVITIAVFYYPQTGYAIEPEPPFLLIEEDTPGLNTPPKDLSESKETPVLNSNSEILNIDVTNAEEPDEFMCENMVIATSTAKPPYFSFLDNHQKLISNYLHLTILSVDNFFATNQAINESTGSHLRLTLETLWPEGQGTEFNGSISLRARLPGIKKKYRLVVESDPVEQLDPLELENRQKTLDPNTEQNRGVYTGVEKSSGLLGWNIKPSLGVKIRTPLDYYARLRLERSDYFQKWALYLNESLYWFDSSGSGFDSTMRWDRPLHDTLLFRTTSFLRYTKETEYFDLSQTAEIIHTINSRSAITYKVGMFGNSNNSLHAKTYLTSLLFRYNLHSDYLFMDLQPQIFFDKNNNFEPQHEFLMRIEIYYRD